MKKRIICLLLVVSMMMPHFSAQAVSTPELGFDDVETDQWYYNSVKYVYDKGLMTGTDIRTFEPTGSLTRAMFVTILGRMDDVDTTSYDSSSYLDTEDNLWYSKYVAWSERSRIVLGYGDGYFGTYDSITREQMATMIARYISSKKITLPESNNEVLKFSDDSSVSDWAAESVELMRKSGIIIGDEKGSFNPQDTASRAEAAAIFMRLEAAIANAEMDPIVISVETSALGYDSTQDSYYISEPLEELSGTLTTSETVNSFEYKVYNDKDMLIETGDIDISKSWAISNIGLFIGKNKVEITAVSDNFTATEVVYITDINGDNYSYLEGYDIDSDGDGLTDYIEEYIGTDKYNTDSDGDGLSDYEEVFILGTDPLLIDSDGNGISDYDEDCDGDGLSNGYELFIGTNPMNKDTDYDGLTDYEEVCIHLTDPLSMDTDSDGASDGWEIDNGYDPLTYNESFSVVKELCGDNFTAAISVNLSGEQTGSLQIMTVDSIHILTENIPGAVDKAYEFSVNGAISNAVIWFEFDESLLNNPNFKPVIYCFNEETQMLEELDTNTQGNTASTTVNRLSTYVLIDQSVYNKAWSENSVPPEDETYDIDSGSSVEVKSASLMELYGIAEDEATKYYTDSNGDGISDYFTEKLCSGELTLGTGEVTPFYGLDYNLIQASNDFDGDGLLNGEELIVVYDEETDTVYVEIKSDPTLIDSDGDGWIDSEDVNPLQWDVGDRDLGMFATIAYEDGTNYIGSMYDTDSLVGYDGAAVGLNIQYFYDFASVDELTDYWEIVDYVAIEVSTQTGFSATTFKSGDSIVIAYRGANSPTTEMGEWMWSLLGNSLINYNIEEGYAESYAIRIANKYPNCKIYMTGYSLGGYLCQFAAAAICDNLPEIDLEQVSYFNGMGLKYNKLLFWTNNDTLNTLKKFYNKDSENLINYYIFGDVSSARGTHSGLDKGFYVTQTALDFHSGIHGSGLVISLVSLIANVGLSLTASTEVCKYYKLYNCQSVIEYVVVTHETASFFYYLTQGTRQGTMA